ncbi:MAG: cyclase [Bdellovibrionales bacterium CG10_big_fil_rev_8_21_14_0_10_45_34]|nr:MAG: cyclase [Bdellovibrionales bacterium CG10_big_fil_rev_8_21_14_0_10_45_34]
MPTPPIHEKPQVDKTQKSKALEKGPFQDGRFHDDDKSRLAVTVGVSPEVAYTFFRNFQNLPLFMKSLKSVDVLSSAKSLWTVEVKGKTVQWEATITNERPNEMIAWQSTEDSEVETSGSIWFSPAPQNLGTVISLALDYKLPGGTFTEILTSMAGEDPKSLAFINLRRLKCFLETGEFATIEGQSSGRDSESEAVLKH